MCPESRCCQAKPNWHQVSTQAHSADRFIALLLFSPPHPIPLRQMLHYSLTILTFILHPYLSTSTLELVWILFDTWHLP